MTGTITNNNNYEVSDIKIYTHITDSSGDYLTSRYDTFTESLLPGESKPLSITACCQSSGTFTPYVVDMTRPTDNTAPVVTVPSNQVFSTTESSSQYWFGATATDLISGTIVPYCSSVGNGNATPGGSLATTPNNYGGSFAVGSHTITCTATDAAGNTGSASFTVTVEQVALEIGRAHV